MTCAHCPRRPLGLPCAGESVPRLCTLVDPSSPEYRPAYLDALAMDLDAGPPPPPPLSLAVSLEATRRGLLNCPEAEAPDCSCEASAACRRLGRLVVLRDCAACLGLA